MSAMFLFIALLALLFPQSTALDNGLSRTPHMGWNTWNTFGCDIDEQLILDSAKAIKSNGLLALGYQYISIDDCWHADSRDPSSNAPRADPEKFPSGMTSLADQLHDLGFKVGLYSSAGALTCGKKFGSLGYETIDAQTYAGWGVDYLKYDNCFNEGQSGTPKLSYDRYKVMSDALNATGRPIVYAMCNWGEDGSWNWATTIANSWRMSGDVYDSFDRYDVRCPCTDSTETCYVAGYHCSIMNILEKAAPILQKGIRGSWPDLDGLEVGVGAMSDEEYRTQFSFWALVKSPLILGNDVRNIDAATLKIIKNKHIIALNQDTLGQYGEPAYRVWRKDESSGNTQLWKANLVNSTYALAILNATPSKKTIKVQLSDFFIDEGKDGYSQTYTAYDLWDNAKSLGRVKGEIVAYNVPSHGTKVYKLVPVASTSK